MLMTSATVLILRLGCGREVNVDDIRSGAYIATWMR